LLAAGLAAVWLAWAAERAEVKRLNAEHLQFLRGLLKRDDD
jgi:hypothetical protein